MADPVPIALGRGSNKGRYPQMGTASHVNAYLETMGEGGKVAESIVCINGQELFCNLDAGEGVREMHPVDATLLIVAGRLLYSTNAAGTPVQTVGGIASDGVVSMAHNRTTPTKQVAIVCDGLWYIYQGGGLIQGTDPDLPPPIYVVESDGYFFFIIPDGRWFIAGPNDGLNVDALDFAEAESSADQNVAAAVRGRTFIPMGERSIEFWDPNGDPVFPYARTTSISTGCYAGGTVRNVTVLRNGQLMDTIAFAATDRYGAYAGVVILDGYTPTVISTSEVDRLIRDEPDRNDLRAMAWTEDGHPFYCISGTNFSKCWDGKTQEWHDRKSGNSQRWNAQCVAIFESMVLFGHHTDNVVRRSRPDLLDEAGEPIVWQIVPPPVHRWPGGFKVPALYFDFITGVGRNNLTDDEEDPEVIIEVSTDGGVHYGTARREKLGGTGQRQTRVRSTMYGNFDHNGMHLRLTISASVVRALQQAAIVARPLKAT